MGKLLKIALFCFVGASVSTGVASAQATAIGYGFMSPAFATYEGDSLAIFQAGGGGEMRVGRAGIGADLGFTAPWEDLSDSAGSLSVNATYYVKGTDRTKKTQPFVTGGYTILFADGGVGGVNLGAGLDHWMTDRAGLRVEFRDHVMMQDGESFHFWGPRIGIVWRGR